MTKRPWHSVPNWPDHVTGDEMVAAMDKVGVDGAIFISAFGLYQYDAKYAVEEQRAHPDRFAIVKPVNPDDPAVADATACSEADAGRGRHPHHAAERGGARGGRSGPRPDPACGRASRFAGQRPVLGSWTWARR